MGKAVRHSVWGKQYASAKHTKKEHLLKGFEVAGLRVPEFQCSHVNVLVILLDFQCLLSAIFELNERDKYII